MFTMYDYFEDIIDSVQPDMGDIPQDPARPKLFNVHETSLRLETAQADFFHSITARLFFCKASSIGYTGGSCVFMFKSL